MRQWESQIRTNLSDSLYAQCLDKLLKTSPGALSAAVLNTAYREGHVNLENGRDAGEQAVAEAVDLACALFCAEHALQSQGSLALFKQLRPLKTVFLELPGEKVLMQLLNTGRQVLVATVSDALNLGAAQAQMLRASALLGGTAAKGLKETLEPVGEILAAAIVDIERRQLLDTYHRYDDTSIVELDGQFATVVGELFAKEGDIPALRLNDRKGQPLLTLRAQLTGERRTQYWARVQFDPEHLLMVVADQKAIQGLVWIAINHGLNDIVRLWVDGLLSYGIDTVMTPFPQTQSEFLEIVDELGKLHEYDLMSRLIIGGFANHAIGEGEGTQRCQECIYYLPHTKWCDLPELPIPVEPHWWCRLWKM